MKIVFDISVCLCLRMCTLAPIREQVLGSWVSFLVTQQLQMKQILTRYVDIYDTSCKKKYTRLAILCRLWGSPAQLWDVAMSQDAIRH